MSRFQIVLAVAVGLFVSVTLGIFILPREVKSTRWMEVDASAEVVWEHIYPMKSWTAWNIWSGESISESQPFWRDQQVQITEVDMEKRIIHYVVVGESAKGLIALDQQPDQLWIQWEHEFEAGYAPWERLSDWASRSDLALQLDQSLKSLRQVSEAGNL
jgi:hypothetical protein